MLIGREIEVVASSDLTLIGIHGLILNETKNTLLVQTREKRQLTIPKPIITLKVRARPQDIVLEGGKLVGSAADRIKG